MTNCAVCGKETQHKTFCSNPCRYEGTRRRNKIGLSQESIEKMRKSLTGRKQSEATKRKRSIKLKAYFAEHPEVVEQRAKNVWDKYTSKIAGTSWRMVRLKALERDNYTCRGCGETNKRLLVVHHVDIRGKNLPSHTMMNNDLNNLMTLCHKCHNRIHRHKGKDYHQRMADITAFYTELS